MDLEDAGMRMKFALHDRDASFTAAFDVVFYAVGVSVIRSAVLYLILVIWWWPALPVAIVTGVAAVAEGRLAAGNLADLIESAMDLYSGDLAAQLGGMPAGPCPRRWGTGSPPACVRPAGTRGRPLLTKPAEPAQAPACRYAAHRDGARGRASRAARTTWCSARAARPGSTAPVSARSSR
jgi:hypothetical protein